jgi:peptidoglycan/LPS O-acetylase OafA/YrhL
MLVYKGIHIFKTADININSQNYSKSNMKLNTVKYENTGLIRFILSLFVILSHFYPYNNNIELLNINLGEVAVSVFFVISGYYVELSLNRHTGFVAFMKSRLLRLMPQFYFGILILFFSFYFMNNYFDFRILLESLMIFPGIHVYVNKFSSNYFGLVWALRLEVLSYVIIGFLFFTRNTNALIKRNYRAFTVFTFFMISLICMLFFQNSKLTYMWLFGFGVALCGNANRIFHLLVIFIFIYHGIFIIEAKNKMMVFNNVVLLLFCLSAFVYSKNNVNSKIFSHFDKYLGVISYDIYIYQVPSFFILSKLKTINYSDLFYLLLLIIIFSFPVNYFQNRYAKIFNFLFSNKSD